MHDSVMAWAHGSLGPATTSNSRQGEMGRKLNETQGGLLQHGAPEDQYIISAFCFNILPLFWVHEWTN